MPVPLPTALAEVRAALLDPDHLVRAVASGRRRGAAPPWRRVELRPVDLPAGRHLQVVRHSDHSAHTANHPYDDRLAAAVDELLAVPFGNWHVDAAGQTLQVRVTKKGEAMAHRAASAPCPSPPGAAGHDRVKPRLLDPGDPLFDVIGGDAAKRRQVDAFLRVLEPEVDPLAGRCAGRPLRVVDLGCGHAYLTFAVHHYLSAVRGLAVESVGVDVRAAARERNTGLAATLGWASSMRFAEGTILDAPVAGADLVLALHACDTATDEALARAVQWAAPLVLAAPCCHHDLQRQLRATGAPPPYALLTRHGILRERFADTLTDALRAALLRQAGYRVEVLEFIDSRHTPRNVLLRAVHTGAPATPAQQTEYAELVSAWSVRPRLADLLAGQPAGTPA